MPAGTIAQGLEAAGALIVVLEQEGIDLEAAEELLGDRVVAALGVPLAAVVAAAEVDRGDDARRPCAAARLALSARIASSRAASGSMPSSACSHSRHFGSMK